MEEGRAAGCGLADGPFPFPAHQTKRASSRARTAGWYRVRLCVPSILLQRQVCRGAVVFCPHRWPKSADSGPTAKEEPLSPWRRSFGGSGECSLRAESSRPRGRRPCERKVLRLRQNRSTGCEKTYPTPGSVRIICSVLEFLFELAAEVRNLRMDAAVPGHGRTFADSTWRSSAISTIGAAATASRSAGSRLGCAAIGSCTAEGGASTNGKTAAAAEREGTAGRGRRTS